MFVKGATLYPSMTKLWDLHKFTHSRSAVVSPLVEPETDVLFTNVPATTTPPVWYPPVLLAEPEPLTIMATFVLGQPLNYLLKA